MLRSFLAPPVFGALLLAGIWSALTESPTAATQNNLNNQSNTGASNRNTQKREKREKSEKTDRNQKTLTAEQVAELTVLVYGSRPVLAQIRRNGVERGRITRFMADGKSEEATYERRFIRGESADKDKIRLDQKMPTMEYSLIFGEGRLWGIINGAAFTPRQDAADAFLSQHRHSIESLLRYKENGAAINLVGKDKQKGLDLYVLDVTDKDKRTTRYYISASTFRVLWLEYEEPNSGAAPLKYSKRFSDYRSAQSTLVPYRTILMEDGKQTQETRILTITFGVKVDDTLFKNPQA
ncbi:MAG: hypothetical protein ACR2IB_09655 [Pyrinomonadaceae bacterium]